MNFKSLNKMIVYIEQNLDSEINLNELSNITNTNLFILERIFMFLTGMTITEYIKKRRLSKAFEEIRNTNKKIIDIAFKYQYNSATSFNRAFKQLFNITPTECRNSNGAYQIVPIQYFEDNKENYRFSYRIQKNDDILLYCYHVTSDNYQDLLFKIKQLYNDVKKGIYYKEFNDIGMYGIFQKINNTYHYYLGSKKYFPNLELYTIKKGKYAVFELESREQKDIADFERTIILKCLPATNYTVKDNIKIECYDSKKCLIYLPIC